MSIEIKRNVFGDDVVCYPLRFEYYKNKKHVRHMVEIFRGASFIGYIALNNNAPIIHYKADEPVLNFIGVSNFSLTELQQIIDAWKTLQEMPFQNE